MTENLLPPKAMTALQNRWYNYLIAQLRLDNSMFQISNPSPALTSDLDLWNYQNFIPPNSLTFNRSLFNGDSFFDEYAAVINQVDFPESIFRASIGEDNYQQWLEYLEQQDPQPPLNELPQLFSQWAMQNAPSVAGVGTSNLMQMVLFQSAKDAVKPYQGPNARPVDFVGNYADLLNTLQRSFARNISFDSNNISPDVNNTWTEGINVDLKGLWNGASPNNELSCKFAASKITVNARFRFAQWVSTPGQWYTSAIFGIAYNNQGTPPWLENADPSWQQTFGLYGSMLRLSPALLVIDELEATVTSDATYSSIEQDIITSYTKNGLWPFYTPSSTSITNAVTFDCLDDFSGMTITTIAQAKNPLVLGANVLSVGRYLGG